MSPRNDDQIFNRDGLAHYRRTYSVTETRIGLVILVVLLGLGAWVAWKGAHPDPGLFSVDPSLLDERGGDPKQYEEGAAPARAAGAGSAAGKRGPVPQGLAADGWQEQSVSSFGPDNLYVKINGRADYYLGLGFQQLYFIALAKEGDGATTVDVEMYDMGNVQNALGTYAGERQPDAETRLSESGLGHVARNAAFFVRGRYYVRAIGSDESPEVLAALTHLEKVFDAEVPAEPLPWGYAIFAGQMGLDPGSVEYSPANAYSFEFADHVFAATLEADGMQIFMQAAGSAAAAKDLAKSFVEGFQSYGEVVAGAGGMTWVEDQYLGNISGAKALRSLVIGVYSAPDVAAADAALGRLEETARGLSDELLAQAAAAATDDAGAGGGAADGHGDEAGDEAYEEAGDEGGEGDYGEGGEGEYGATEDYGDQDDHGGPGGAGSAVEEM